MFLETSDWLPDVLEEHLELLTSLWNLRLAVLRSREWFPADLARLDRRIDAQLDGLLIAGNRALPLLRKQLKSDDRAEVFAAASPLLASRQTNAVAEVMAAAKKAPAPALAGFVDAFCQSPIDAVRPELLAWLGGKKPDLAAVAAEVLAFHNRLPDQGGCLEPLLSAEGPADAVRGWRAVAFRGFCPLGRERLEPLLDHEDAALRQAIWSAARWSRQPWLDGRCRDQCELPRPGRSECCETLALLGTPADRERIARLLADRRLGPERLQLAAIHGHPDHLALLVVAAADADDATAVAAGQAFARLTGCDVDSDQQVTLPPADGSVPDEFEQEFLDTAARPDPVRCRTVLDQNQSRWQGETRICCGYAIPPDQPMAALTNVDLQSRWELTERGAWLGLPGCHASDLVRLTGRISAAAIPA